jgi:hypothetical protein
MAVHLSLGSSLGEDASMFGDEDFTVGIVEDDPAPAAKAKAKAKQGAGRRSEAIPSVGKKGAAVGRDTRATSTNRKGRCGIFCNEVKESAGTGLGRWWEIRAVVSGGSVRVFSLCFACPSGGDFADFALETMELKSVFDYI